MTRWARGKAVSEHEATPWNELKHTQKYKKNKKNIKDPKLAMNKDAKAIPVWLQKRREARRNRRKKAKPCFYCREGGHQLSDCPKRLQEEENVGICFKCGAAEHSVHQCKVNTKNGEYPYAKCFICKEDGHLSSACPDNPRGLYPDGGGCKFCGSVEHYRKDCPERQCNQRNETSNKKRKYKVRDASQSVDAVDFSDENSDDDEEEEEELKRRKTKGNKLVKF